MTLMSMTGFARSEGALENLRWFWELKSVNGRGLDIRLRLPPGFDALEAPAREALSARLTRGALQVSLQINRAAEKPQVRIDEDVLARLLATADDLRRRADAQPPTVDGLLALKGVIEIVEPELTEEARAARDAAMLETFMTALDALVAAREQEGARLKPVLVSQLDTISGLSAEAEADPGRTPEAIRERLTAQVEKLMQASEGLDEARLHQEAMLLAAKADVREELDRLNSHVDAGRELLAAGGAVGRRLDFLTQEFNREANTLCAKANTVSLSKTGLELKAVIDQFREQVQNIE